MTTPRGVSAALLSALLALGACSDGERSAPADALPAPDGTADTAAADDVGPAAVPLAEALGLTQYAGRITPLELSTVDGVVTYTFDAAEGPRCMRGGDYKVGVRDTPSDDLLIFLEGGGVCSTKFCLAVTGAPDGIPSGVDILNPALKVNPTADWDVVYLPYCDGSFFLGDASYDDDLNGKGTRYHHGLANLTAGFEVAAGRFPHPARILLGGSSGGAYGLLLAWPLLRAYYPHTPLIVMADSGIGLARDGDDAYVMSLLDEFNITRFLPKDCTHCIDHGHMTGLLAYLFERDPNARMGMYSSWYDTVLSTIFLQVPSEQFATALQQQTDRVAAAYPDRFRRFVTDGNAHTALLGNPTGIIGSDLNAVELPAGALTQLMTNVALGSLRTTAIGDVTMSAWLKALIDDDRSVWVDLEEPRGPVPGTETP